MARVTFYGGAGGVTGSKHLLDIGGIRILLDCGTFQGLPDVRERNRSLPFPPESVDHVILSHAHIDHCGMLPLLVKRGYTGKIWATAATCEVAGLMLQDMAGIEQSDADYRSKHKIGAPDEREPLFTAGDVERAVDSFEAVPYVRDRSEGHELEASIKFKLYEAGHILGSAIILLEYEEDGLKKRLIFTGDLGPKGMPLLYDPEAPKEEAQSLIMESTYGSRTHEPFVQAQERLAAAINQVYHRSGKMIIPAFSLGRTQAIVYVLHKLTDAGRIPEFPIYVDSPLAVDLTKVYRSHRLDYDKESWTDFAGSDGRPLAFRNLTYVQNRDQSIRLNDKEGPFMVISASGMMTAGRVVHHLKHTIGDSKNAVFVTGYQAQGTLGRSILEGARRVEIMGDEIPVRASVFLFNEFSAHADQGELRQFAEQVKGLERVFLVHGEPHQADDLKKTLQGAHPSWEVKRPSEGEVFSL